MQTSKLYRTKRDQLIGGSGARRRIIQFFDAMEANEPLPAPENNDDWGRFIVIHEGRMYVADNGLPLMPYEEPFFAIGSGSDLAMGAMAMGATAVQAVEIANKFHTECGMGVDYLRAGEGR